MSRKNEILLKKIHDLLSCSYLQHCVGSLITGHNSITDSLSSELRTSAQHARNSPIVTVTVEREQLIDQAPHENCDIHTLSMI